MMNIKKPRVLVTGDAGFLGRYVVAELEKRPGTSSHRFALPGLGPTSAWRCGAMPCMQIMMQ